MKKRQTAKQEKKLEEIKKTYPDLKLIDHNEFVKLHHPDIFPISNESRFYREVSNKILQSFSDFHYAFLKLPSSYKIKILTSRDFSDFINMITSQDYVLKKSEDYEKAFTFLLYQNFFNIGIKGLIETMPREFQTYLNDQMRPILSLMHSIAEYSLKMNPKSKVHSISIPTIIGKSMFY